MNLLYLTHDLPWRSAFIRTFSLAKAMVARGHAVTLLASREDPGLGLKAWECYGVQIVETGDWLPRRVRNGGLSPMDLIGRLAFSWPRHWDVVHAMSHRPAVMLAGWSASRRSQALLCFDWMDGWGFDGIASWRRGHERWLLGLLDEGLERLQLRLVDGVTAVNSELHRRAALRVGGDRVVTLPPGANTDLIRPEDPSTHRARFGFAAADFVVVNTSQNSYDADLVLDTLRELVRACPRTRLLWAGPAVSALRRRVDASGVGAHIHFPGLIPYLELHAVLACGDVMFLPFRPSTVNAQRSPSRLGDYLAAGRPVVTNPAGDMGDALERSGAGRMADPSPAACARAILDLATSAETRMAMGCRARMLAETTLDWALGAAKVDAFYDRLRNAAPAQAPGSEIPVIESSPGRRALER